MVSFSMRLALLHAVAYVVCMAMETACSEGASCPSVTDLEVNENLNLLQVGIKMHSLDDNLDNTDGPDGYSWGPAPAWAPSAAGGEGMSWGPAPAWAPSAAGGEGSNDGPGSSHAPSPSMGSRDGIPACAAGCPIDSKMLPTCDDIKGFIAEGGCASECPREVKGEGIQQFCGGNKFSKDSKEGPPPCVASCPFDQKNYPTCDDIKDFIADGGCASECPREVKDEAIRGVCGSGKFSKGSMGSKDAGDRKKRDGEKGDKKNRDGTKKDDDKDAGDRKKRDGEKGDKNRDGTKKDDDKAAGDRKKRDGEKGDKKNHDGTKKNGDKDTGDSAGRNGELPGLD